MDLAPELKLDTDAMKRFMHDMSADGQTFVTMNDITDAEMMRREDEDGTGRDGDEESGAVRTKTRRTLRIRMKRLMRRLVRKRS